jgi:plasmid stabilization system protein ParE
VTPVRYHEAAEEELLHEIGYLELRANGLGRRFLRRFRDEKLISQFPESSEEIRPNIRNVLSKNFAIR